VIPGSKATVSDLGWLRERGLGDGVTAHARRGKPVLGICGGFQMLCRRIDDPVESKAGGVDGLGLLDAEIGFAQQKTLRHHETPLYGYEIHHGQVTRSNDDDWVGVGIRRETVYGTHWHGLLDNNDFRRQWLTEIAPGFVVADDVDVAARRDGQLDLMADLLTAHLDVDAILALLDGGAPMRPTIRTALA
jgi:adenosylcobyric acid synthase